MSNPTPPALDVKKLVDTSGQTLNVNELEAKGFKQIQVLEKNQFNNLLQEAVDRVLGMRSEALSHEQRARIMEETKMEMRLLAQEQDMFKEKANRDKDSLLREVENLQQQMIMHRKLAQEQDRVRFDEGVRSLQPLVAQLQQQSQQLTERVKELETQNRQLQESAHSQASAASSTALAAENSRAAEQMTQQMSAQMASQMSAMAAQVAAMQAQMEAKMQAAVQQASQEAAQSASQAASQAAAQAAALAAAQAAAQARSSADGDSLTKALAQMQESLDSRLAQVEAAAAAGKRGGEALPEAVAQMQAMLDQRLKSIEEAETRKDADSATLAEYMLSMRQQMESRIGTLQAQASAGKNDKAGADLEKMMMRLGDTLGKKILSLKNGDGGEDVEYRPSAVTMQQLLSTEGMESNLADAKVKQETAKGASSDALAKLKAMKGGGAKP